MDEVSKLTDLRHRCFARAAAFHRKLVSLTAMTSASANSYYAFFLQKSRTCRETPLRKKKDVHRQSHALLYTQTMLDMSSRAAQTIARSRATPHIANHSMRSACKSVYFLDCVVRPHVDSLCNVLCVNCMLAIAVLIAPTHQSTGLSV